MTRRVNDGACFPPKMRKRQCLFAYCATSAFLPRRENYRGCARQKAIVREGRGRVGLARATLIGIDIGTGAIKAVLIDVDGNTLETFARAYPTARPSPGHVEQDPRDWMAGVRNALKAFAAAHDMSGLLGIGLC